MSKRIVIIGAVLALAVLFIVQIISYVVYRRDSRKLSELMDQIASPSLPESEQALAVLKYLKSKPDVENQSYFLLPVFSLLRPTAMQVHQIGGDCADRSRLTIVLLRKHGIEAEKWALYDPYGKPKHAVVEADTEKGAMVIDTLFGIVFPKPGGGYYDIRDMEHNPAILRDRIMELRAKHEKPGADSPEEYPLNEYVYGNARSINWNKSSFLKLSYRALHALMGSKADTIRRPYITEEPALMVIVAAAGGEVVILIFLLVVWRRSRRTNRNAPDSKARTAAAA